MQSKQESWETIYICGSLYFSFKSHIFNSTSCCISISKKKNLDFEFYPDIVAMSRCMLDLKNQYSLCSNIVLQKFLGNLFIRFGYCLSKPLPRQNPFMNHNQLCGSFTNHTLKPRVYGGFSRIRP